MIYYSREQAETEIEALEMNIEVERHSDPVRWWVLIQQRNQWQRYLNDLIKRDRDADEHGNLTDGWGNIVEEAR